VWRPPCATLERLGGSPEVGAVALRWLLGDCLRRNDLAGADRFSSKVLLSAADEPALAAKYLALAKKGQLLPEEKALLAEAVKAASRKE
jgi:hypothetical protein